jgi:hypothetical protein
MDITRVKDGLKLNVDSNARTEPIRMRSEVWALDTSMEVPKHSTTYSARGHFLPIRPKQPPPLSIATIRLFERSHRVMKALRPKFLCGIRIS